MDIATPAWFLPFLKPSRYKGGRGGRGSGKSHTFAEAVVERMVTRETRVVCGREKQNTIADSIKTLIEDKIRSLNAGAYFECLDHETRATRDAGRIIYKGLSTHNAEAIKSLEGADIALFDEAQSLGVKSLNVLIPTVRKPLSELWFVWNPISADDPIEQLLCGPKPPTDSIVRTVNWRDNPWFPAVLDQERRDLLLRDPVLYDHVWEGGYRAISEGLVFTRWRVSPFDTPASANLRLGADWGFAQDPTTLVRAFLGRFENGVAIPDDDGRTLFVDYEAYEVGCEIDKTPDLFDTVPESRRHVITADSARPETVSYMRRNGFPKLVAAVKGPGSVEDGVEWLRGYDIVVNPRCVHVLQELARFAWKVDAHTGKPTGVLADKDNHTIDALRYAFEGLRRAIVERKRAAKSSTVVVLPTVYHR